MSTNNEKICARLKSILTEVNRTQTPNIMQIAFWCKSAAENIKRLDSPNNINFNKQEICEELFRMAEVSLNHKHATKSEIDVFKNVYLNDIKYYVNKIFELHRG